MAQDISLFARQDELRWKIGECSTRLHLDGTAFTLSHTQFEDVHVYSRTARQAKKGITVPTVRERKMERKAYYHVVCEGVFAKDAPST